jgi:hypothetical protein
MIFNRHSELAGLHSFLSASKYHWINYSEDKLDRMYIANQAAVRGTELHALAAEMIRLKVKPQKTKQTLNMYVNDCIGFHMTPEQVLFYSDNAFGTADAIGFRANKLRIFDLKTGAIPGSVHQLEVYAAYFCLEYRFKPVDIEIELRLYQNNDVLIFEGDPMVITQIMSTLISFDKRITALRMEALS